MNGVGDLKVKLTRCEILWLLGVLCLATFFRLLFVIKFPWSPAGDPLEYHELAVGLRIRGEFSLPTSDGRYELTGARFPGYPVFLAICYFLLGDSSINALNYIPYVQLVLGLGICVLTFVLSRVLLGKRAGWIALILISLDPYLSGIGRMPMTETLAAFLLLSGVTLATLYPTRPLALSATGIFLGWLVLTRLQYAPLLPLFGVIYWFFLVDRKVRGYIIFSALASSCLVLPWLARNWVVIGTPLPAYSYANNYAPKYYYQWCHNWVLFGTDIQNWYWFVSPDEKLLPPYAYSSPREKLLITTAFEGLRENARVLWERESKAQGRLVRRNFYITEIVTPREDQIFKELRKERLAANGVIGLLKILGIRATFLLWDFPKECSLMSLIPPSPNAVRERGLRKEVLRFAVVLTYWGFYPVIVFAFFGLFNGRLLTEKPWWSIICLVPLYGLFIHCWIGQVEGRELLPVTPFAIILAVNGLQVMRSLAKSKILRTDSSNHPGAR